MTVLFRRAQVRQVQLYERECDRFRAEVRNRFHIKGRSSGESCCANVLPMPELCCPRSSTEGSSLATPLSTAVLRFHGRHSDFRGSTG